MSREQLSTDQTAQIANKKSETGKNENLFVSVITPFMNEEKYLKETIESVIGQTFSNWELLLVDDGSKDNSTNIAKEYASRYPGKIFYYEHEGHANKGVSATRNLGVSKANGDFIALLDGDDLWLPEKLEKQVEIANKYPSTQMICEASHYMNKGSNPKNENIDLPVGAAPEKFYPPQALATVLYPLGKGDAPCVGSLFINTQFAKTIGGFEESFIGRFSFYEDQAFLFKIYFNGEVYISSNCNNIYRQRPESSMHRLLAEGNYRDGRKYFLQWLRRYLDMQKMVNPAIQASYRKAWLQANHPRIYKYSYGLAVKIKKQFAGYK